MSRIAIMQPYFFPYLGYFQLISTVDRFVYYDDVDFIKNGWINRNKILINKEAKYFTIPCNSVSSNKKIKDIEHNLNNIQKGKLLKKIKFSYRNAPFFDTVYPFIERVVTLEKKYIVDLAIQSIEETSSYLKLNTEFIKSSESYSNKRLERADRLIDICNLEGVTNYINAVGGKELYKKSYFKEKGINLKFLETEEIKYKQFGDKFIPQLSIIDVMMFNSVEQIQEMLKRYRLT